jgi:hypothetical protein
MLCETVHLGFVHPLNYIIIKPHFRRWILLPSSSKIGGGGGGQKAHLLGPLVELILLFYNLENGQSPKEQYYISLHTIIRNLQILIINVQFLFH